MKVLVVEDDHIQSEAIVAIINQAFPDFSCVQADNYHAALSLINNCDIDLFLLDVDLGNGNKEQNGISIGQYIRSKTYYQITPILFITALSVLAPEAIHLTNCFDYIVKPYNSEELIYSIRKLLSLPSMKELPIRLKGIDGVFFQIYPKDIIYVQSKRRLMNIYTKNRYYTTSCYRFSELINMLPKYIIRCHKSYAVSNYYISHIDTVNLLISLVDNTSIPIGKAYINLLKG